MKRSVKNILFILLFMVLASVLAVFAFAQGEDAGEAVELYKIVDREGNTVKVGTDEMSFCNDVSAMEDGETVILLGRVRVGEGVLKTDPAEVKGSVRIRITNDGETHKTVSIDLCGNQLIFVGKLDMNCISVCDNVTCNLYSSKPGGYVRENYVRDGSSRLGGDPLFNNNGENSVFNIGKFTAEDGTVYPGSNLSAATCAGFQSSGAATSYMNIDGGTYVRNDSSDHRAFFLITGGNPNINVKNANIISSGYVIRLEVGTMLMENCVVSGLNSGSSNLVNNSSSPSQNYFCGTLILRNSVVNSNLTPVSEKTDSEGNVISRGRLVVEEGCVFPGASLTKQIQECMEGIEGKMLVRANGSTALKDNGTNSFMYMCGINNDDLSEGTVLNISGGMTFTDPVNVVDSIFYFGNATMTEQWDRNFTVEFPFTYKDESVDGIYKTGVMAEVVNEKITKYRLCKIVDFDILISVDTSLSLTANIYIPAIFYEEYMDVTESLINGEMPHATMYTKTTVEGKDYYKVPVKISSGSALSDIEVSLQGSVLIEGKREAIYGKWSVSLLDYCRTLTGLGNDKLTQAAYDLANCIKAYSDSYVDEPLANPAYGELAEFLDGKTLSATHADVLDAIARTSDSSSLKASFANAQTVVSAEGISVRFSIPSGFEGKVRISAGGYADTYEVKNGKYNKNTYIEIYLPARLYTETLTVKAYNSDGVLVASDGADVTGVYSIQNAYSGMDEKSKSILLAVIGFGYSANKYLTSIPATK